MHTQHPVGFGAHLQRPEGPERAPWTLSREVARGLNCELGRTVLGRSSAERPLTSAALPT